ncbi:MAG: hypothetical protein ACM3XM_00050 [Mycobacterium leprae]
MHALTLIAGHQVIAWALGLIITIVFLDLGAGFTRDHPPLCWRVLGMLAGPLTVVGYACLSLAGPWPYVPVLSGPFVLVALRYSWAWYKRQPAEPRRGAGRDAAIVGVGVLLFLMLSAGPDGGWTGGIVMGAYGGSAALLGGLTTLLVIALTARVKDEVEVEATPYGVPARVAAAGLSLSGLAGLDLLTRGLSHSTPAQHNLIMLWLFLSLCMPAVLIAAGHRLFPRFQKPVWVGALLSAVGGQVAIYMLLLLYPVLVPSTL